MKFIIFFCLVSCFLESTAQNISDQVLSCDDLHALVENSTRGDIVRAMDPFADIVCPNFTTFNISSGNSVTIKTPERLVNTQGSTNFINVRFNVTNGSSLTLENNVYFVGEDAPWLGVEFGDQEDLRDVDGGAIYIGVNSEVNLMNDFESKSIGVMSTTGEDSDFAEIQRTGGVIFNEGNFTVGGESTFISCENLGGGESSPGPGGCVYNGESGRMMFKGGVEMRDVSITDDEGNSGGGFFNLGVVHINGDSKFSRMRAEEAGAIHNGEGATFIFCGGASVIFNECTSGSDGLAGSIFNGGYMEFTGPSLFLEGSSRSTGGAITVGNHGELKLSENAIFFENESGDSTGAPVYVRSGGIVEFSKDGVLFINNFGGNDGSHCFTIYDEFDGGHCIL